MQLEINVTQFLCIPVGDNPRMQLMTHYTHQWKAAEHRRTDRGLAILRWSVLSEDTVLILSLDVLYIIRDSSSFLLPYVCHVSTLAEKTLVHNKIFVFLCRQLMLFLGFQLINSTLVLILSPTCFIQSWFQDQQLHQFCFFHSDVFLNNLKELGGKKIRKMCWITIICVTETFFILQQLKSSFIFLDSEDKLFHP